MIPSRRAAITGQVLPVMVLLALLGLAAGWAGKAPCLGNYRASDGSINLDWRDWKQYRFYCYSDTIPLYGLERLQDGSLPYKTSWTEPGSPRVRYMEYPVLTGFLQYGAMRVAKWIVHLTTREGRDPDPPEVVVYFTVMSVFLALCWLAAVLATLPLAGGRPWLVALMALSPLVMIHAFTNFDTLAVAFACGGMLAWTRNRPWLAGVLLGLGAAAKLYPLFLLGPLLILGLRTGRLTPWAKATVAAVLAWAAVNGPVAVLYPHGWWEFFRLNTTRPADYDSIYNAIQVFTGWGGFDHGLGPDEAPHVLNAVTLGLFAAVCLAIGFIGLTASRRPRVAALSFLVVAAFLLTNKVWSPQYSLWLVPLAVLAVARWLPVLIWMVLDAVVWFPRIGYFLRLGDPTQGNSAEAFMTAVVVRDIAVVVLCGYVLHDIYRPDSDPVRRAGRDDPCGGVLEDAPDVHRPLAHDSARSALA